MANIFTVQYKAETLSELSAVGFVKVALLKDIFSTSSTNELAAATSFDNISATWEASGTGYTAGGKSLSGASVVFDYENRRAYLSASDTSWSGSSITAYGAVLYKPSNGTIVQFINFGGAKTTSNAPFTILYPNGMVLYSL